VKPFEHLDKDFVHYSLPAFDDGLVPIIENGKQIKSNKYAVKNNTILVSKLNPFTPRVWTIFKAKDNHICSTEFQVFEPKKPFNEQNLYLNAQMASQILLDDLLIFHTSQHATPQAVHRQFCIYRTTL
jgi:type I restriction enzyme S subunit